MARQIREKFPGAYTAYVDKYQKEGWKLGDVQIVELTPGGLQIANCATQRGYGYQNGQMTYVNYDAVATVFRILIDYSEANNISIAMPRIGAGLAGGDWTRINSILQAVIQGHDKAHIQVYSL